MRVAVECKDHRKRVDIGLLDAFDSKSADFGMQGLPVNRAGCTQSARPKAKTLGIQLIAVNDGPERLRAINVRVPPLVIEMGSLRIRIVRCPMAHVHRSSLSWTPVVSGKPIDSYIADWIVANPPVWPQQDWITIVLEDLKPWRIPSSRCELKPSKLELRFKMETVHDCGFLD